MARYFFHTHRGKSIHEDDVGQELPDLAAAGQEAVNAARELFAERSNLGNTRLNPS